MLVTINLETGEGRVKTVKDGVPDSLGFESGDVEFAEKYGFTKIADQVWTDEMKEDFLARKAAITARSEESAQTRADTLAAAEQARVDGEAAFKKRVTDEVAKQLAAK